MEELIEQLRASLPPIFLGSASDDLTGRAVHWPTIQNKRSRGEIPADCFVRSGPRVLVVRDRFLDWWRETLHPAVDTKARYTPAPRAGSRANDVPQRDPSITHNRGFMNQPASTEEKRPEDRSDKVNATPPPTPPRTSREKFGSEAGNARGKNQNFLTGSNSESTAQRRSGLGPHSRIAR